LDKKLATNEFFEHLPDYPYGNLKKITYLKLKVFNEKNLPLAATMRQMEQEFAEITGRLTIHYDGKELTLHQAAVYLQNSDRKVRKDVFAVIAEKRATVKEQLDELYDNLVSVRTQIALNAGYDNYRDFKFDELGRTDYTAEDCYNFHESVKKYVLPLVSELYDERKHLLGVDKLMPYDLEAELPGEIAPKPKNIVTILCDTGERYLSTDLFD
jgi:oligoendopeptidase F